jgi:subtilase-type serine protease
MNRFFSSSASYLALLAAGALLSVPFTARADSFTVPADATQTKQQTVSGTDSGQIDAGGTLDVTKSAIIWNGAATGPSGISIVNDGQIISGNRAIDTSGTISGPFMLRNDGSIESKDDTLRINDALENGNLHVVNNSSMVSNTGQVLDLNGATSGTATVLIENTGTMKAQENDAIRFGAGTITLINSGTIEGQDGNRALSFDDDGNIDTLKSFKLVNQVGGKILGSDDAFKISADSDDTSAVISIENHGLIDGGEGQAFDFADLTSPDNVITVTNYATGIIQSQAADAMRPGAGAVVTNYGLIQSTDLTSDGDGVDFQGAGGTVVNKDGGQILGAKHGITGEGTVDVTNEAGGLIVGHNGSGINIDSTGSTVTTVTNYGTIRGAVTGLLDDDGDPAVPDGDGDGVDVDGKVVLDNYGLIQGTGATGTKDDAVNTADGIAAGGGSIHNHAGGVIEAFDNYFNDGVDNVGRAILVDDSAQGPAPFATTITNEGIIRSDGVTVTLIGDNADTIDNAGLIQSDNAKAVDMGGGDDRFV